jgi:hypothetical protein
MIRRASGVEREGELLGNTVRWMRGKRLADERGVAMTEFALVLPVLMLVLAGLLAFGRLFFYWLDANRLAGETARWAVVDQNPFGVPLQQYVVNEVPAGMKDGLNVCIDFRPNADPLNPGSGRVGDPVRVRIEKSVALVPILGIRDVTIRASSTMRIERFANGLGPPFAYKPGPPTDDPPGEDIGSCT